jgi:hypothetical protein
MQKKTIISEFLGPAYEASHPVQGARTDLSLSNNRTVENECTRLLGRFLVQSSSKRDGHTEGQTPPAVLCFRRFTRCSS